MAAPVDRVTHVAVPAGLTIEQIPVPGALEPFVEAYAGPMGVDDDQRAAALRMVAAHPDAPQHLVRFAGWRNGRIVGTSARLDSDGVARIYVAATREPYRGRGIGAALTAAAIGEGRRRGPAVTSLQASALGKPVHERLGLRTVAGYRLFRHS